MIILCICPFGVDTRFAPKKPWGMIFGRRRTNNGRCRWGWLMIWHRYWSRWLDSRGFISFLLALFESYMGKNHDGRKNITIIFQVKQQTVKLLCHRATNKDDAISHQSMLLPVPCSCHRVISPSSHFRNSVQSSLQVECWENRFLMRCQRDNNKNKVNNQQEKTTADKY